MTIRIGLIGTGRIAEQALAPAIVQTEGAELWSVLSRDRARAALFAERYAARAPNPAYDDLDAMLADEALDAVLIATPDRLHAEQTIAAARAGKHVLVEKPMATEVGDAWAMVEACREADVRLGVAYHMRWHAGHRLAHEAASRGRFGPLRHMRLQWAFRAADDSNWRAHPEVGRWWSLAGVGTHCLDQVRWFLCPQGGEVRALASVINRSVWKSPHDETAVLALQLEDGTTAEVVSSVLFTGPRRFELYGADGWIIGEETLGPGGDGRMWTNDGEFEFPVVNPYVGEIRDFVLAIVEGRAPEVDGEEGARNVELLVQAVERAP